MLFGIKMMKSKLGKLINSVRYFIWRLSISNREYHDYYVENVNKIINSGKEHPTLGGNIRDRDRFERTAVAELEFLKSQGLITSSRIVDFGCGSLRLGRKLIEYLAPNCYTGLDVTTDFINAGKNELDSSLLQVKKPCFGVIGVDDDGIECDYLISTAVLYHVSPDNLKSYFMKVVAVLSSEGKAYIDFTASIATSKTGRMTWAYSKEDLSNRLNELNIPHEFCQPSDLMDTGFYPTDHTFLVVHRNRQS